MHISAEGGQGDLQGVAMIGKSVIGSFSSDSQFGRLLFNRYTSSRRRNSDNSRDSKDQCYYNKKTRNCIN